MSLGRAVRRGRGDAGRAPGEWLFRPFLTGERGGVAGPRDRGGWSGLPPGTTRADLARAAVEGVAFAIGAAFAAARRARTATPVVLTGGGGAVGRRAAAAGRRAAAGRCGTCALRSASAIGAAVLAGRGVGLDVVPEAGR